MKKKKIIISILIFCAILIIIILLNFNNSVETIEKKLEVSTQEEAENVSENRGKDIKKILYGDDADEIVIKVNDIAITNKDIAYEELKQVDTDENIISMLGYSDPQTEAINRKVIIEETKRDNIQLSEEERIDISNQIEKQYNSNENARNSFLNSLEEYSEKYMEDKKQYSLESALIEKWKSVVFSNITQNKIEIDDVEFKNERKKLEDESKKLSAGDTNTSIAKYLVSSYNAYVKYLRKNYDIKYIN